MQIVLQVLCNKTFGAGQITIQSLRDEGYEAIFLGFGLPNPNMIPIFDGLTQEMGFWTSKTFLPVVAAATKAGELGYLLTFIAVVVVHLTL